MGAFYRPAAASLDWCRLATGGDLAGLFQHPG
jgi:hypothetical protein